MQAGYTVVTINHYHEETSFIQVANQPYTNRVIFVHWGKDVKIENIDPESVAIFKIKPKTK